MINREKVIGELKEGIDFAYHRCQCGLAVTMEMALSLLNHDVLTKTEAIIPIMIQKEEDFRSELIDVYCCGNCRQELQQYPRKWNYCPICGKAVKWD